MLHPNRRSFLLSLVAMLTHIDRTPTLICRSFTAFLLVALTSGFVVAAPAPPDFNREIRPLLSDRCLACHGPDATHREAELRLDQFDSITADRGDYAVVVPGDPKRSELMKRITSDDPDLMMPPQHLGKQLSPEEVDLLRRWIESGAEIQPHWAYVPPKRTAVPDVDLAADQSADSLHWIDRFVLHRLEQEQLRLSPMADPVTLMRRLHFDLTGLPPAPEVVQNFANDPTAQNYEQIVDDLLQSDACAERLAMYWLDLVRYADTVGYHGDQDHNISPYRDWVIDAFAENMPLDQFSREQLAGDLLPDASIDQKIASGYNRLLQTSHEGGVQPKEYLAIYAADRVRNVSAVWLGATVGCAQCHDHKYDPYTAKDFYSLAAFFADIDEEQHFKVGTNGLPTKRPPEMKVLSKRERKQLTELEQQRARLDQRLQSNPDDTDAQQQQVRLKNAIDDLHASARLTMVSVSKEPRVIRLLPRGNWLDDSGPIVEPAVPEFLGEADPSSGDRATRLDLANWLFDTEDGVGLLTARVFANRLWYLMYGNGISASLDDFGGQGQPPEHPELLDQLALELVESGWDVKHLLKLMAVSRTYRQSSEWTTELLRRDPNNRLYARQNSFRLPAEMIRDQALAISGLLVRKVGGPSVRPYQPAGYYRHLNFPKRTYSHHDDDRQWRRGLYVHWQRQFLHPMLKAFDAPTREECTAARPESNTPLAALTLLNDPTFTEAARAFATRILQTLPQATDEQRLQLAMQLMVSRDPDAAEQRLLLQLKSAALRDYRNNPAAAEQFANVGLSARPKQISADELAAWAGVARALLNLDEAITRN